MRTTIGIIGGVIGVIGIAVAIVVFGHCSTKEDARQMPPRWWREQHTIQTYSAACRTGGKYVLSCIEVEQSSEGTHCFYSLFNSAGKCIETWRGRGALSPNGGLVDMAGDSNPELVIERDIKENGSYKGSLLTVYSFDGGLGVEAIARIACNRKVTARDWFRVILRQRQDGKYAFWWPSEIAPDKDVIIEWGGSEAGWTVTGPASDNWELLKPKGAVKTNGEKLPPNSGS